MGKEVSCEIDPIRLLPLAKSKGHDFEGIAMPFAYLRFPRSWLIDDFEPHSNPIYPWQTRILKSRLM